jgi:hypothetical protein
MGTLAETAIVDYRLSFTYQGIQTYNFCFLFGENKRKYAISVCLLQTENRRQLFSFYRICIHICCHFKWKTEDQAIFLNPFTSCSSCKLKFVICLFLYKETGRSYPFANGLNGLAFL